MELCLYSDSKWCVDIFNSLQLYECRGWVAKGKSPVGTMIYGRTFTSYCGAGQHP